MAVWRGAGERGESQSVDTSRGRRQTADGRRRTAGQGGERLGRGGRSKSEGGAAEVMRKAAGDGEDIFAVRSDVRDGGKARNEGDRKKKNGYG